MIIVVVLQNSMDLLKGELGSSSKTCITSTVIKEEEDQEPTTIPIIKTEPEVSYMPVVSVTHISYRLYAELPACLTVCVYDLIIQNGFRAVKKKSLRLTAYGVRLTLECFNHQ